MPVYGTWLKDATVAWLSGKTIKAMLVHSTYAPNPDETDMTAATAAEISGSGYTAGGIDITADVAFIYEASSDSVKMTCSLSQIDFGTITATDIAGIVFYVSGGVPIAVDMFGSTDSAAADFTYGVDPIGLVRARVGL